MTLVRRELMMLQREDGAPAPESRTRRFIASDESVDSYNTKIFASAWRNPDHDGLGRYAKNGVVLAQHRGRELPIGKGTAAVEGKQLMLDVDFFAADVNPLAEQFLRILDQGVMGASVGFNPIEWEYDESRETGDIWQDYFFPPNNYTKVELFEVSIVTLPANANAVAVGREHAQRRFLERQAAQKKPAPTAPSPADLRKVVDEIIKEELRAATARRRGTLSGA